MSSKDGVRETLTCIETLLRGENQRAGRNLNDVLAGARKARMLARKALTQLEAMERDREAMEKMRQLKWAAHKWSWRSRELLQLHESQEPNIRLYDDPADAILGREQDDE